MVAKMTATWWLQESKMAAEDTKMAVRESVTVVHGKFIVINYLVLFKRNWSSGLS